MAILKRRNQVDHDSPAAKKPKTFPAFTLEDFMEDFPIMEDSEASENEDDSPLPSTVLSRREMQVGSKTKPTLRSTFNIKLPKRLMGDNNSSAQGVPFEWMKNQYSHCIIPELGEEYDFEFDSSTFHCLRDLHNARVRTRDGEPLLDYLVCSLATRWISLEEESRPASDGYLANSDIFVATCLPLNDREDEDALQEYFEICYSTEPSAQHYIPRSKYSVHFSGQSHLEGSEITSVIVGSVLIRNTRTGNVIHIDTGALAGRKDRARDAGQVLHRWLEFQKKKSPKADLGPIINSEPLVLDVDEETHPELGSIHALVSASLLLRRRIPNWGQVRAFQVRGTPTSAAMADYALQNISGWLGLKFRGGLGETRPKNPTKAVKTFKDNYTKKALFGRAKPAPVSERIASAQKGQPTVYNEDTSSDDDASNHEDSRTGSSVDSSHDSVSNERDTVIPNQPDDDDDDAMTSQGDETSEDKDTNDKELDSEEPNSEQPQSDSEYSISENLNSENSDSHAEDNGNADGDHSPSASA